MGQVVAGVPRVSSCPLLQMKCFRWCLYSTYCGGAGPCDACLTFMSVTVIIDHKYTWYHTSGKSPSFHCAREEATFIAWERSPSILCKCPSFLLRCSPKLMPPTHHRLLGIITYIVEPQVSEHAWTKSQGKTIREHLNKAKCFYLTT